MPRVSVIIPAYNYARFLPQAIESALAQTVRDREVIVVDDGSTDETPEAARRYAGRIRYHRQDNRGLSAARNAGCRLADGEYLALLDADDVWARDKLERQVAVLEKDARVGLVSGMMDVMDAAGQPLPGRKPSAAPGETFADIAHYGTAAPSTFMIRRTAFDAVGGFNEALAAMEDLDLCLRIARRYRIVNLSSSVGRYRVHGVSLSGKPEKVYPSYLAIYERLLHEGTRGGTWLVAHERLAHFRYLWGRHQLAQGRFHAGRGELARALVEWPLVGWSLDVSRPWWRRAITLAKPYGVVAGLFLVPRLMRPLERI